MTLPQAWCRLIALDCKDVVCIFLCYQVLGNVPLRQKRIRCYHCTFKVYLVKKRLHLCDLVGFFVHPLLRYYDPFLMDHRRKKMHCRLLCIARAAESLAVYRQCFSSKHLLTQKPASNSPIKLLCLNPLQQPPNRRFTRWRSSAAAESPQIFLP